MTCKPRRFKSSNESNIPLINSTGCPPSLQQRHNSQGFAGSIGLCWITGKSFVRKIRIVFERSCWLNYVYVAATLEARQ